MSNVVTTVPVLIVDFNSAIGQSTQLLDVCCKYSTASVTAMSPTLVVVVFASAVCTRVDAVGNEASVFVHAIAASLAGETATSLSRTDVNTGPDSPAGRWLG
jgi:hypothetical protein